MLSSTILYWDCGGTLPLGIVPGGHGVLEEVVPVLVWDEFPGVVVEGDAALGLVELGLVVLGLVVLGFVELGLVELALVEPGVAVDPLGVAGVPAVVTQGVLPGVLGVVGWLPAGVPGAAGFDVVELGFCGVLCVVLCGVLCVLLPAALVVIGVGGPAGVEGVVAGACPGPVGGAAVGVEVCAGVPGAPGAPPGEVLCAAAQLAQQSNRNSVVIRNVIRVSAWK